MSGLENWFPIFRSGTHTDSSGRTSTFTDADLDGIVERYDSASSPAPCVITHDELYSPFAYGQIGEIKNADGVLQAKCKPGSVEPQFERLVADGNLYNRSVQLLPERDSGGYRLGHVAFLGAEPPAVQGMEPIQMSAAGRCFTSDEAWDKVREAHRFADLLAALKKVCDKLFGADSGDNPVREWDLEAAQQAIGEARANAKQQQPEGTTMNYTQAQLDEQVKAAEAKAKAEAKAEAQKALDAERAEFAAQRAASRRAAIAKRIDGLVSAGRVLPAEVPELTEFAAAQPEGALEFSRPGDDTPSKTEPLEYLFGLLEARPVQIALGQATGAQSSARADGVDTQSVQSIRAAARQYMREQADAGIEISYPAAVKRVSAPAA